MWYDKSRFKPLHRVFKIKGSLILVIDRKTGQPYCAEITKVTQMFDVDGKVVCEYDLDIYEHKDWKSSDDLEIISTGAF